jgi:hypothetical protein
MVIGYQLYNNYKPANIIAFKGAMGFSRSDIVFEFQIWHCFKGTLTSNVGSADAFLRSKRLSREDRSVLQGR